jgi:hypothetical protein
LLSGFGLHLRVPRERGRINATAQPTRDQRSRKALAVTISFVSTFNACSIITNPPYELATEFCDHALKLMETVRGLVAMLLRCDFDHAQSRTHLFRDCPPLQRSSC